MLVFGFCGEGIADYKFTLEVARRTVQDLLPAEDVLPIPIEHIEGTQEERIIYFAERTNGYHMAFVHLDADGRTRDRAYAERFYPGYQQVQARNAGVNKALVPIIPIKMTEAWMLADFEAFRDITGTRKTADQLSFPSRPHQAETLDAKQIFESAVRNARPGRRRQLTPKDIYFPLAEVVNLALLRHVPAFKAFESDLKDTLVQLNYVLN